MPAPRLSPLAEGDSLPDVSATDATGNPVRLRSLLEAGKTLVIYFYPKDDSLGCTAQACSFRDQYEDFVAAGADVVGISADAPESHTRFASKHRLPFRLLSDKSGEAREAFGVRSTFGLIPGRVTFVVDAQGIVRYAFDSQVKIGAHVEQALEMVRKLKAPRP